MTKTTVLAALYDFVLHDVAGVCSPPAQPLRYPARRPTGGERE
ncbi:hypothetical protein [Streptomyces nodosus]